MRCPYCGNPDTRVIDSRPAEDKSSIRRRRSCDECGRRFTTYEKVETIPLIVIKKDNNREQYDRNKILAGVLRACIRLRQALEEGLSRLEGVEWQLLGPAPAPVAKVNNRYRYRLVLSGHNRRPLRELIAHLLRAARQDRENRGVTLWADCNPMD